jgi:predicted RNA-binding protein with PIN domain
VTSGEQIVLVDAWNVMRSRWPNIREERFVELVREWAEQEGLRVVAVFDGHAPGGSLGVHDLDGRTTIVGTGRESADDWIAEHAGEIATDGDRLWLVSSDRELRRRVADHVERVIGGGSFAGRLLSRPTGDEEEAPDGGDDE